MKLLIVLFVWLAILSTCSSASVIANTFLPGQKYRGGGDNIDSNYYIYAAAAFTTSENDILSQIDVAIATYNSSANLLFNLSLNQDSGGAPGAIIESWSDVSAAILPPSAGDQSGIDTVFSTSSVDLSAGTQYWIVASAPDASFNDLLVWWSNSSSGATGGTFGSYIPQYYDGWLTFTEPDYDLAFDVLGMQAPEPETVFLLGLGLLGVAVQFKRQARVEDRPRLA